MKNYIEAFQQLPLNLVYSFDEPDDQISVLNKLITDCIDDHAPLKKVKLTRPIAPWMNDPKIKDIQDKFEKQRLKQRDSESEKDRQVYRELRNKLKTTIKST